MVSIKRRCCATTDGTGFKGNIAAAAYSTLMEKPAQKYLGSETEANIYVAEVTAMGTDIFRAICTEETKQCTIYTDSQAAIIATTKPGKQSEQAILRSTIDSLDRLKTEFPNAEITITWVPGHRNIHGNDKADEAAKNAAEHPTTVPNVTTLPLKSTRNWSIKNACKKEWERMWKT